ncbi:CocE/NonD family hydrolase [Flavobacterium sp. GCM10023249]|uniref:CocE/NonD family hydrolase n=1 Tax=unclassified Flavobacterium TaxID=196869 RepID=UPI00361AEC6D
MKKTLLLLLVSCTLTGWAQNIPFPKEKFTDSTAIAQNMVTLAEKLIPLYQNKDKKAYLENRFRLEFLAKSYPAMEATLKKLEMEMVKDSVHLSSFGFGQRVYVKTSNQKPQNQSEFTTAFKTFFDSYYDTMDMENQWYVDDMYNSWVDVFKDRFASQLKAAQAKDSISINEAVALCKSYSNVQAYGGTLALAKQWIAKKVAEKYVIDENILITLPNGSTIAGTLVRSSKVTTPQPVVMLYNIYAGIELGLCKEIASRGYVGFIANTRGKRLSNDPIEPFEHDGDDAYAILDWVSQQPWCNGKIGMYGGSYLGFSQWSATKKLHPALKTIVPQVSVGIGIDYPMHNGVFMGYALSWIRFVMNNKLTDDADFDNSEKWAKIYTEYYKKGASFRSLDSIEGSVSPIFQRWLDHPSYDSYWQNMVPQKEDYAKINIPILTTTGYYDDDQLGALSYYKEYQKWNKSNNYYLLIGPYNHGGAQAYPRKVLGGYEIDAAAQIDINQLVFDWFDYTLKDGKRPELLKDKVNFQVMGKNEWQHAASLEKMHNSTRTFYLGSQNNQKVLLHQLPKKRSAITQTVDYKDRSEINIYKKTDVCNFPAVINKELLLEKQLMVFESEPMEEAITISGALEAALKVRCNKKDIDIALQLYEKTANNDYFALTNNLQRASYAKDRSQRQLLRPNTIETIHMKNTYTISKQIEKGSRIVIVLGMNKNPNWEVNYGTGKPVSEETMADGEVPLEIEWFNDSTITLPILK